MNHTERADFRTDGLLREEVVLVAAVAVERRIHKTAGWEESVHKARLRSVVVQELVSSGPQLRTADTPRGYKVDDSIRCSSRAHYCWGPYRLRGYN
jgi:hypothetical protein